MYDLRREANLPVFGGWRTDSIERAREAAIGVARHWGYLAIWLLMTVGVALFSERRMTANDYYDCVDPRSMRGSSSNARSPDRVP